MTLKMQFYLVAMAISVSAAVDRPTVDLLAPFDGNNVGFAGPKSVKLAQAPQSKISNQFSQSPLKSTSADGAAQIVRFENDVSPDGSYQYAFETDNGIQAQERGTPAQIDENTQTMNVQGGYSYTAPDGSIISMNYVANENGFQPQGDHIPQPPPVPEAIQRALQYILSRSQQQQN